MSETKRTLPPGASFVGADATEVEAFVGTGVLACVFSVAGDAGAVVHLNDIDRVDRELERLAKALRARTSAALNAKLIGGARDGASLLAATRRGLARLHLNVIGEDVGGDLDRHAFFHVRGGRLQVASHAPAPVPAPAARTSAAPAPAPERRRKVLIVDDSKTIRDLLVKILSQDAELEIVGQAVNPIEAQKLVDQNPPDVITLDMHMPEMTGLEWLTRLLPQRAIPVVMITSLELQDGNEVFRALECGAVDYIQKPTFEAITQMAPVIREKVKTASFARVRRAQSRRAAQRLTSDNPDLRKVLAIGSSTGGTEALKDVLSALPERIPPTVIVQHIPPVFSTALAARLDGLCPFTVKEAEDGDRLQPSLVLLAPGARQMRLERRGADLIVRITDDPPVNHHRPSVDYLFDSVAELVGSRAVGVILTGMGADGAKGLLRMRQAGARTIGQDEATSVVYGMPKAAFQLGAVEEVRPLEEIAAAITERCQVLFPDAEHQRRAR